MSIEGIGLAFIVLVTVAARTHHLLRSDGKHGGPQSLLFRDRGERHEFKPTMANVYLSPVCHSNFERQGGRYR